MQERDAGFADRTEIAAEAEVNSCEDAVKNIPAQIPAAGLCHCRIGGKQTDNRKRNELHENGHDDTKACSNENGIAKCPDSPVLFAGTDVLCAQCRNGGEHGGGNQEQEADDLLDDADGRGVHEASLVGDDGDEEESHLNQTVLGGDGKANPQNLRQHVLVRLTIAATDAQSDVEASDGEERDGNTDGL